VPDDADLVLLFRLLRSARLNKKNRPKGGQSDLRSLRNIPLPGTLLE